MVAVTSLSKGKKPRRAYYWDGGRDVAVGGEEVEAGVLSEHEGVGGRRTQAGSGRQSADGALAGWSGSRPEVAENNEDHKQGPTEGGGDRRVSERKRLPHPSRISSPHNRWSPHTQRQQVWQSAAAGG